MVTIKNKVSGNNKRKKYKSQINSCNHIPATTDVSSMLIQSCNMAMSDQQNILQQIKQTQKR